jgi:hypothetical protein
VRQQATVLVTGAGGFIGPLSDDLPSRRGPIRPWRRHSVPRVREASGRRPPHPRSAPLREPPLGDRDLDHAYHMTGNTGGIGFIEDRTDTIRLRQHQNRQGAVPRRKEDAYPPDTKGGHGCDRGIMG